MSSNLQITSSIWEGFKFPLKSWWKESPINSISTNTTSHYKITCVAGIVIAGLAVYLYDWTPNLEFDVPTKLYGKQVRQLKIFVHNSRSELPRYNDSYFEISPYSIDSDPNVYIITRRRR